MFAPDVAFEGFSTEDWSRFLSLFEPRRQGGAERDPHRPRGTVFLVYDDHGPLKAISTRQGRMPLSLFEPDWPYAPEEAAKRAEASLAILLEVGVTARIMDRFALGIRRGDDLTTQSLLLLSVMREEADRKNLQMWPPRMRGVPIPTPPMVRTTFDAVCPPGRSALICLFDREQLWTAIALRRTTTGIDAIVGPKRLRRELGLLAGDWRRDYRHVGRAAEDVLGPLALGCYSEVTTLRDLEVDPSPGAWARAVVVRDVILSPVPAALGVPLGIDVGRAAISTLRNVAERFDPLGLMGPTMSAVRGMFMPEARDDEPSSFDFSPLEILRRLLERER